MLQKIIATLFDLDGSMMRQGGLLNPAVAAITRKLGEFVYLGVATGKSADQAIMLGRGAGFFWNHISGEGGAQFYRLATAEPIPIWESQTLPIELEHLWLFAEIIRLDLLRGTFLYRNTCVSYRPELKSKILTLFPVGDDIGVSIGWLAYFQEIIRIHALNLVAIRHSDGAIDILPAGVSKQLGVITSCRIYGCERASILTVVDGANDWELADGTTAIAVANASPQLKEFVQGQGGFVASLPEGFGFAEGLLFYLRKGMLPPDVETLVLQDLPEAQTPHSKPK